MPTFTTSDGAVIGFVDEGSGAPVVLVPGLCCSQRWWDPQREALVPTHRIISLDFRGVSESLGVAHGHRVARYSQDVAELLEHLELRGVVLVGWSLGYSVSLGLVDIAGQERLAGLVLVEGSPRLLNDATWQWGIADLDEGARIAAALRERFSSVIDDLVRSMFVRPEDDPALALLLADAGGADPGCTARLFWDHLHQDWRDVLGRIRVPTLAVAARRAGSATACGRPRIRRRLCQTHVLRYLRAQDTRCSGSSPTRSIRGCGSLPALPSNGALVRVAQPAVRHLAAGSRAQVRSSPR